MSPDGGDVAENREVLPGRILLHERSRLRVLLLGAVYVCVHVRVIRVNNRVPIANINVTITQTTKGQSGFLARNAAG